VRDDFSFTGVFASGAGIEEASADWDKGIVEMALLEHFKIMG
jgi:hypothetical protein